ncbi:hypothetical protein LDENG_00112360 [Lucifuga dentata]|nr:hypothetical protein LDENG_00112360 [Lucifuga dentata]
MGIYKINSSLNSLASLSFNSKSSLCDISYKNALRPFSVLTRRRFCRFNLKYPSFGSHQLVERPEMPEEVTNNGGVDESFFQAALDGPQVRIKHERKCCHEVLQLIDALKMLQSTIHSITLNQVVFMFLDHLIRNGSG